VAKKNIMENASVRLIVQDLKSKRDALSLAHEQLKKDGDGWNKCIIVLSLSTGMFESMKIKMGWDNNLVALVPIALSSIIASISALIKFKKFPEQMEVILQSQSLLTHTLNNARNETVVSPELLKDYYDSLEKLEVSIYPDIRRKFLQISNRNLISIMKQERKYQEHVRKINETYTQKIDEESVEKISEDDGSDYSAKSRTSVASEDSPKHYPPGGHTGIALSKLPVKKKLPKSRTDLAPSPAPALYSTRIRANETAKRVNIRATPGALLRRERKAQERTRNLDAIFVQKTDEEADIEASGSDYSTRSRGRLASEDDPRHYPPGVHAGIALSGLPEKIRTGISSLGVRANESPKRVHTLATPNVLPKHLPPDRLSRQIYSDKLPNYVLTDGLSDYLPLDRTPKHLILDESPLDSLPSNRQSKHSSLNRLSKHLPPGGLSEHISVKTHIGSVSDTLPEQFIPDDLPDLFLPEEISSETHIGATTNEYRSETPTEVTADEYRSETPTEVTADEYRSENPTGVTADEHLSETPTGVTADEHHLETPTGIIADEQVLETPTGIIADEHVLETPTGIIADETSEHFPLEADTP